MDGASHFECICILARVIGIRKAESGLSSGSRIGKFLPQYKLEAFEQL